MITSATDAAEYLAPKLPGGVSCDVFCEPYELNVTAQTSNLLEVLRLLKQDEELLLDWYSQAFGIDRGDQFEVVHHLQSTQTKLEVFVRVQVPQQAPVCPSAVEIFMGADWHEREIHDMFGIEFEGHPDLRVILLPEGFVGHPLRKDWKPLPG